MPIPHSYDNLTIPATAPGETFTDSNPLISDVESKFGAVSDQASHIRVRDGRLFPFLRYTRVNVAGINWGLNHIQGVQRLRNTNYLVISAGDKVIETSHLFLARLGTRRLTRYWGSNILSTKDPHDDDTMVQIFALDKGAWHAGGISVMGDVLAVPLYQEEPAHTKVIFLNMREPEQPTLFSSTLNRDRYGRSNAVALAKMTNGRYLCAVWREVTSKPQGRIDFHLSVDNDFRSGFHSEASTWSFSDIQGIVGGNRTYQNINFILPQGDAQSPSHGGSTVFYMIGTQNDSKSAPAGHGSDLADLFRVELPNSLFADHKSSDKVILTRLATRKFHAGNNYANFNAAGGIYVSTDDTLALYAGYHWRNEDLFGFAEFPPPEEDAQGTGCWVELFEDRNFLGRRLTLRNRDEASIPNFGAVSVQGKGFDDKISSLRFFAPAGTTLALYEKKNFDPSGNKVELAGTGTVQSVPNLDAFGFDMDDEGSSMQFI